VRTAPTILEAFRRADDLIDAAARDTAPGEAVGLLADTSDTGDARPAGVELDIA